MTQRRVAVGVITAVLLAGCTCVYAGPPARPARAAIQTGCIETGRTYAHVEVSFRLRGVRGNPFAAEVWAIVARPGGSPVRVPAFFDGGDLWRARYTPDRRGLHRLRITTGPAGADRPAQVRKLSSSEFTVAGGAGSGFVRRSSDKTQRFVLDNAEPYFPIGYNVAWTYRGNPEAFEEHHRRMRRAGINWSRHWMAGFAQLQLDWHRDTKGANAGRLSLEIARKWDRIVRSAEENGIRFQLVLQHHGQYSTSVSSNWEHCPWNVRKGGFLEKPEEYFTSKRALELTRLKYRYIVARWGHSTAIMAWELFNEVQLTDAGLSGRLGRKPGDRDWTTPGALGVVRWHNEMAAHVRSLDPYKHLVTTSSGFGPGSPIMRNMDYYQPHIYRRDMIAAVSGFGRGISDFDKPVFYGETGYKTRDKDVTRYSRSMLWAGVMAGGAGAAQKWFWDRIDAPLYDDYRAVRRFLEGTGFGRRHFSPVPIRCASDERIPLTFQPGGGFRAAETVVDVPTDGRPVEGLEKMPSFLHGDAAQRGKGGAGGLSFNVNAATASTFTMVVGVVAKKGAEARVLVDGEQVASRRWPAAERDTGPNEKITVSVPAGRHVIRAESTGEDWFRVTSYSFSGCTPALAALGCSAGDAACLWVYSRLGIHQPDRAAVHGTLTVPGLKQGTYDIQWWDTRKGTSSRKDVIERDGAGALTIKTPPITRDAAVDVRIRSW